jgi:hypothetical protein
VTGEKCLQRLVVAGARRLQQLLVGPSHDDGSVTMPGREFRRRTNPGRDTLAPSFRRERAREDER